MKFENKKFDWKKRNEFEENASVDSQARRERKKERREKYKVKNQKYHQLGFDPDDEYGGMF